MILLLNVSVEPFFIALLQEDGVVFARAEIPNNKQVGEKIFEFCEAHKTYFPSLVWVGGVTGPGGFATLRLGASLISSLNLVHKTPIRSVTAFEWVSDGLTQTPYSKAVLNSFGSKVFLVEGMKNKAHELIDLDLVPFLSECWYGSLPESKRTKLGLAKQKEILTAESLYKICIQKRDSEKYVAEYYFDAVESG